MMILSSWRVNRWPNCVEAAAQRFKFPGTGAKELAPLTLGPHLQCSLQCSRASHQRMGSRGPSYLLLLCPSRQHDAPGDRLPSPCGKGPHYRALASRSPGSRVERQLSLPVSPHLAVSHPLYIPPTSQRHKCTEAPGGLTLILNACC